MGFYAVLSGRVRIYQASAAGKEITLHAPGPGEVFAEAAVFQGGRYPAAAQTLEASELLFIERVRLRALLAEDPELALAMLGLMAQRLRFLVNKIETLTLKEAPARLASHLLLLAAAQRGVDAATFAELAAALEADAATSLTVTLTLPKGHLATLLGATPETLSRALRSLADRGFIVLDNKRVTLLDPTGLHEVAEGLA